MKVSQFDGFVNNATDEILGVKGVNRENLEPMLSTSLSPNITPLIVRRNGVYYPDLGIDGFSPVWVDVEPPTPTPPVIQPITITENGVYNKPSGVDGYNPITVNVPSASGNFAEWDFTSETPFVDTIRGISIAHSTSSSYEIVSNGIKVLDDKYFRLTLQGMYCRNMTYTVEFAKFINTKAHNIRIIGVPTSSQENAPTNGFLFGSSNDCFLVSGYTSTSSSSGAGQTQIPKTSLYDISDGDTLGIKFLSNQKWAIYHNGDLVVNSSVYLPNTRGPFFNVVIGSGAISSSAASASFEVGTIIKKLIIS